MLRPLCLATLLGLAHGRFRVAAPTARAAALGAHNGVPTALRRRHGAAAPQCCASPLNVEELAAENVRLKAQIMELEATISNTEGLCEVLDDGGGWTSSLGTRASWLLGLLVCQSLSSFILADNEALLVNHPTVIFFMTMLVGAGGNAGNQAAVRIIRGLATGEVDPSPTDRTRQIFSDEVARAGALALILVVAGFVRVVAFQASIEDAAAISAALFIIVSTSVVLGTLLPLLLQAARIDAAHASTTIQVVMDVLGVLITCTVAPFIFETLPQLLPAVAA